jgi:hypothetical protein
MLTVGRSFDVGSSATSDMMGFVRRIAKTDPAYVHAVDVHAFKIAILRENFDRTLVALSGM